MALQYVGGFGLASSSGTTYTVSLTGLTGGLASSPSTGDVVVVSVGRGGTSNVAPTCSGNSSGSYTGAASALYSNDTWDTNYRMFYMVMGATPDTSLTINRASSTTYGFATTVQVWRGVDTTTPLDVTSTTATGINTSLANPPSITPTTAGAIIIAGGAACQTSAGAAFTIPSGMANGVSVNGNGSTADIGVFIASYAWTSGAYDPAAVTGGTTSTSSSWAATTIALRPGALSSTQTATARIAKTVTKTQAATANISLTYPTVDLNTPSDAGTVSTLTPQLKFTGTNPVGVYDNISYEVQIYAPPILADNYSSGVNGYVGLDEVIDIAGQTFTGTDGNIDSAELILSNNGVSVGYITAYINAISGTSGVDGKPTGSPIATSTPIDISTLTTSSARVKFTFPNKELLVNGTSYALSVKLSSYTSGEVRVWTYGLGGTDDGNIFWNGGTYPDYEAIFAVYMVGDVIVDALSATNPGFINLTNSADTDPFASGDQIGYTVQSALTDNTTYYWRVRAKNTPGGNAFSNWSASTVRSFTTSMYKTKTQSAIARIAKSVTKTQSATAKVMASVTKTQTATARIAVGIGTVTDDFNDNTFDSTKWDRYNAAQTVETNGQLEISTTTSPNYYGIFTLGTYSLYNSGVFVNIVSIGNTALASYEAIILELVVDASNKLTVFNIGGTMFFRKTVGGSNTTLTTEPYSATGHAWIRIREAGGTVYFDKSIDCTTWNNVTSTPTAGLFDMNFVKLYVQAGTYSIEATTTKLIVDNVNIQPNGVTKTQPAIARIANTMALTQSAIAKVAVNAAKTQSAIARVSNIRTKTQSGISRIANVRQLTQSATARTIYNRTKTQTATARIVKITTKTQPAVSRIRNTITITQTATATIGITRTWTQTAISRVVIGGYVKRWNGFSWEIISVKAGHAGIWKNGRLRHWDGTTWRYTNG